MQDGFWEGFGAAFAAVGALVAVIGLIWLVVILAPSVQWWTVKRLPLQSKFNRANAAGVVAGARRAYVLRIPYGVRLIVAIGGTYDEMADAGEILLAGLARAEDKARQVQTDTTGPVQPGERPACTCCGRRISLGDDGRCGHCSAGNRTYTHNGDEPCRIA